MIDEIIKNAMERNPREFKKAVVEELRSRLAESLSKRAHVPTEDNLKEEWEVTMPLEGNPDKALEKIYNKLGHYDCDLGLEDGGILSAVFDDQKEAKKFAKAVSPYRNKLKNQLPEIKKI
jgi:hypothetical protein